MEQSATGVLARSPYFLSQRIGRWQGRWLVVGLIGALVATVIAGVGVGIVVLLIRPDSLTEFENLIPREPPDLIATLLLIGLMFWSGAVLGSMMHGREPKSLLAPSGTFRWLIAGKVGSVLVLVWGVLRLVGVANPYLNTSFTGFDADHALWLGPTLLAIFVQTSGEDAFFKGYLLRQIGASTGVFWFSPLVVTVAFVSVHIANPDVQQNVWVVLPLFVTGELLAIYLLMRTGGMEAPLVLHFVNNATILLVVGSAETQANDLTLFVAENTSVADSLKADLVSGALYFLGVGLIFFLLTWQRSPFHLERVTFELPFEPPAPPRPPNPMVTTALGSDR